MKKFIKKIIIKSIKEINKKNILQTPLSEEINIETKEDINHGDFSTNLAIKNAKIQRKSPKELAILLITEIKKNQNILEKIEIAGPGFINFFIKPEEWILKLKTVYIENEKYGSCNIGNGKKVQVEFVSSNPTGPLHIGHGRGAAVGDSLANLLKFCGFNTKKEYYINDSGNQINTLGLSLYLQIKNKSKKDYNLPDHCYQGNYIKTLANDFLKNNDETILNNNKSEIISLCAKFALKNILKEIQKDLLSFGIQFDSWFSEQSLFDKGKVKETLDFYRKKNLIYKKNNAEWFSSSKFDDIKDRVIIKENGDYTYFASDIAYHKNKFDRGFDQVINIWGADHHGYIPRIKSALRAINKADENKFKVILVKLVNLSRNKKIIPMSTRKGEFITLKEIINEVGRDAARFLFLSRHYATPLNFDIEIAKKKNIDNPVYYVQYAHARISNIVKKACEKGFIDVTWDEVYKEKLNNTDDISLIKKINFYPEIIKNACKFMEPHKITFYLIELASKFHTYYNKTRIISDEKNTTKAKLYLIIAVKKVIKNGLKILGISAPKNM